MKSSCRHCADSVHSGSWIRICITQCGKCFEFWFVLPTGIKTLTVKIGMRPIQKLNLFSLASAMYYIDRKRHVACPAPVSRCPLLQLIPFDTTAVHAILLNPAGLWDQLEQEQDNSTQT